MPEVEATRATVAAMAATWGLVMAMAPVLQMRRLLRRGTADDVSIGYLMLLLPGFALWVIHGYLAADMALVVPNSVALVTGTMCAVLTWRLRHRTTGRTVTPGREAQRSGE